MQRVYKNCYEMDRKCYEVYGLSEDLLMEHAADGMAQYIKERFSKGSKLFIVAGPGNNGADGITLARLLQCSYEVSLYLPLSAKSNMAKIQLERAKKVGVKIVEELEYDADIIVDAIFGAGLSRTLSDDIVELIEKLNSIDSFKIACDIPTGLDERGVPSPVAFIADTTITMGALKESLYLDMAKDFAGEIICVDLGVDRELYENESSLYLLEESDFKAPFRDKADTHKGSYGHSAVFCGEKEGAGIIAGMACSRFGSGLTTLVVHERVSVPYYLMHSTSVPPKATAIAIGMGLGNFFESEVLERDVIKSNLPLLLDADALSMPELLSVIHQNNRAIVLTPHPAEFSRMWKLLRDEDLSVDYIQENRFDIAREFTSHFPNAVLLLKGANPIIAHLGKLYINPLGDERLAKGGSGDVLSGLIVSLLAQGYSALDSAINASLALSIFAKRYNGTNYSMLPTDLIESLKYFGE